MFIYTTYRNDVMILNLCKKLHGEDKLSDMEKSAIEYILLEYEKLHKTTNEHVTVQMSEDMWKRVQSMMFKRTGEYK